MTLIRQKLILLITFFQFILKISCDNENLWAVLVSTSNTFENYRHSSNILKIYSLLKSNKFPDERIILMNAEDFTCNPRNAFPGSVYFSSIKSKTKREKVCCESNMNVDYKRTELTNFSILNLLKGRSDSVFKNIRQLNTNSHSNIFIYITSHGGEGFIRIRTKTVILTEEFRRTLLEMHLKNRYKAIFLVLDTCEAFTFFEDPEIPNIFFVGSSLKEQKALSFDYDEYILTPLSDRFSFRFSNILEEIIDSKKKDFSIDEIIQMVKKTPGLKTDVGVLKTNDKKPIFLEFFGDGDNKIIMDKVLVKSENINFEDENNEINIQDNKNDKVIKGYFDTVNLLNFKAHVDNSIVKEEIIVANAKSSEGKNEFQNMVQMTFNAFFMGFVVIIVLYTLN